MQSKSEDLSIPTLAGRESGNSKIAIVGAGAMGSGICQVAAMAGHEVLLFDSYASSLTKAKTSISTSIDKLVEKGKITSEESAKVLTRISYHERLESIDDCSLIIEAIIEDAEEKKRLFSEIESLTSENTVIASNTSSLSITGLAGVLKNPQRFIGIHFFNPPVLMKLVEIIPAIQTSENIINQIKDLVRSWGKVPVLAKDTPGFIVNRIARPFYGEALRIVEEQLASPELVDQAMKELGGFKMGPFELMDFIGNDINEAVTRSVWTSMHFASRYKPSLLQEKMVKAGWLGRKSGKGFYNYSTKENPSPSNSLDVSSPLSDKEEIFDRIVVMLINEAADAFYQGIASRDDIDLAMTLGVNYPKGLLKWADEKGIANCVSKMDSLHDFYKEERYRCSPCLRRLLKENKLFYEQDR